MKINNNFKQVSFYEQLKSTVLQLQSLEAKKEKIYKKIKNILTRSHTAGIDNEVLKELLEIHKDQKKYFLPLEDICQLYNHLWKWKNIRNVRSHMCLLGT